MTIRNQSGFTYMLFAMLLLSTLGTIPILSAGDSGGTDEHIEIDAAAGSGKFAWNETHGFVLMEDGEKVNEEFNVTICENVKWKDEKWRPSGHIFGKLEGIHWNDDPEPSITISKEDFEAYKEDDDKITVYVLGEYEHPTKGERQAYRDILVQKPNHAPVAVAWVAEKGNWTWVNLSETNNVTFLVEDGDSITLWFNGSESWDPDEDEITEWHWDFDEDGNFGQGPGERGVNKSRVFAVGKSYDLGLLVIDKRGKDSRILDFTIRVVAKGENGGSDENIEVEGAAGGGEFAWNQIHGFAIVENGEKVDEMFNVTICENLKWEDEQWRPCDFIFGGLIEIRWDDDPEPSITVSETDFENYKQDKKNLTVYVYGEYENQTMGYRYAYRQITITQPNIPPVPVAWVAAEGIWNWSNLSETDEVAYILEDGDQITLWFNASDSWDPDGDKITAWEWDFNGDGNFGDSFQERGENKSRVLNAGKSYSLGLIVYDAEGMASLQPLNFTIWVLVKEECGGSDNDIEVYGMADGGGEFAWNDIRGFVISEDGLKIKEEFNVTVCKDISWEDGDWRPSGFIFGELHGIHWDEQPAPRITISEEDFENYKQDEKNLTVYIYGEYEHPTLGHRCAYEQILVQKPNHAPIAVAWVAEVGNWTWVDLSESSKPTLMKDPNNELFKLCFNASESWDPDGDNISSYAWDLDGDDRFGQFHDEKKMNGSAYYDAGTYHLGLMVGDGNKHSHILDFTIYVIHPIRKPDLTPMNISCENQDPGKQNYDVGDAIIISSLVKNIGNNVTKSPFDVLFEYSRDDGATYTYLANITVQDNVSPNEFRNLTWLWDTNLGELTPGNYSIRVTVDSNDDIREESEDNNTNTLIIHLEDNISPTITITFPENGAVVNGTIAISGTALDNVGIVKVEYRIPGSNQWNQAKGKTTWSIEFDTTQLEDGEYTMEFRAYDGKQYSEIESLTIHVKNNKESDEGTGFIPAAACPVLLSILLFIALIKKKRLRNT